MTDQFDNESELEDLVTSAFTVAPPADERREASVRNVMSRLGSEGAIAAADVDPREAMLHEAFEVRSPGPDARDRAVASVMRRIEGPREAVHGSSTGIGRWARLGTFAVALVCLVGLAWFLTNDDAAPGSEADTTPPLPSYQAPTTLAVDPVESEVELSLIERVRAQAARRLAGHPSIGTLEDWVDRSSNTRPARGERRGRQP